MELFTPRLHLREITVADAEAALAHDSDPDSMRYVPHHPRTLDECRAYIEKTRALAAETPRRVFDLAVTLREGGRYLGRAGFRHEPGDSDAAAIWYMLDPAQRGHGYASEAVRAVLDFALGTMAIHRAYADIDPRNAASRRVAEAVGMRLEAHHVEDVFMKGEWCDSLIFAVLRREWVARSPA